MSVIIRLQNLPWTANALDIRRFFNGLHIPDGGVHIVGGEKGDAFIAFATDDDARQAMLMDGGRISDCNVKLYLSSKTEMQNVIAVARGGGATVQTEDSSTYGRPNATAQNAPPMGGPGNLMGQQQGFSSMTGDFSSPSRPSQSNFNSGSGGGSGNQFGRGNDGILGNFGDSRSQNRMSNFGVPSQSSSTTSSQGFQSGQSTWDRPMQPNLSSSGGDFGGNVGMQQQNQMGGGFGGRDNNFSGRDSNRESNFSSSNQFSSGSDMGRQSSGYGGSSMSGTSSMSNYGRESSSSMGGGMGSNLGGGSLGGNLSGNMGSSLGGNLGSGYGNMSRDNQKGDSYIDRPREETNIFLQPRDQVRTQTGNIFLQGRDQNRSSSLVSSASNFGGSSLSGSFNSSGNQMGNNRFTENNSRNRFSENTASNNRFSDNSNRSFQEKPNFPMQQDMNNQRGFQENRGNRTGFGSDNRSGFNADNRSGFTSDNHGGFNNENRGGFGSDNRGNFSGDNRRDDRRGGMERRREIDLHVLINDMPIKTSYRDLRRFFGNSSEIIRDGVKLINDKYGQRIGKAFVKFASEQDCRNALRRNGDMIDGKRVNIQKCPASEYEKAIDSFQPPPEARRPPPERREATHDSRDHMHRPPSPKRNRAPSPKAHVPPPKMKLKEDIKPKAPVKKEISPKPKPKVESVPKAKAEPTPKNASPAKRGRSRSRSPPRKKQATESGENCCILLKNLPFKAQKHDIKKFFGHLKIAARGGPYFEVRNDGKHTGTAFVQFETSREAKDAMRNDGKPLNGRSVEMVPISKREFEENVSSLRSGTPEPEEVQESQNGDSKDEGDQKFYCIKMKGLPYSANNQSVREFFEGLEIANRGIHVVYNGQRQAAGTAFVEFVTARDCKKAQDKHKSNMGKRYILIEAITKKEMLEQLQKEQQRQREQGPQTPPSLMDSINFLSNLGNMGGNMGNNNVGNMGGNMNMGSNMNRGGNSGGGDGNRSGGRLVPFMVQLQNLPFKVHDADIMSFFRGYGPVRSSLKLDERDGRPSGKAVIGFHTSEQQERAMNELNKKHLMGRPIHIHPGDRY